MDMALQKRSKDNLRNIVAFILWAVFVVFLFTRHENWRDEAQAWLLARDLDIPGLIAQMKYEGHPCLWHLILMPFAKLGFPYITTNIISMVITAIAVALLLWKAPFPFWVRIATLCGAAFLYYMPVYSRSYCMIPLFLFINACIYPSRRKHPLFYGLTIALLVQTHTYVLGLAGMMSFVWLFEAFGDYRKDHSFKNLMKQAAGLLLPLLSLLFLLVQIASSTESSAFHGSLFSLYNFFFCFARNFKIENTFMPSPGDSKPYFSAFSSVLSVIFAIALIIAVIMMIRKKNKEALKIMLIFGVGLFARVMIDATLYSGIGAQKRTVLLYIALWMLWVLWNHIDRRIVKRYILIAMSLVLFVNSVNTIETLRDIPRDYTDAKNCAAFINDNIPEDALLFQNDDVVSSAIIPYMNRDGMHSLINGKYTSFTTWKDVEPAITDYATLCEYAKNIDPSAGEVYIVSCPLADVAYEIDWFPEYFTEENIVYKTAKMPIARAESYIIYRVPLQQDAA